jgi:phospholipid/cholesterol/gamma-HCH transport system substrate-binding protein
VKRSLPSVQEIDRLRLGIVSAVVLSLIALGALALVNLHLGDTTYRAEFARADGAKSGNEVRIAGVKVGTVTGVELDKDRIVVSFRVAEDIELGARTSATMKMSTLLGAFYMELSPRGTGSLKDNRIPLSQTESPFTIEEIVTKSGETLKKLDEQKLRDSMVVLTNTFGRDGKRLGRVLDGVSSISRVATVREQQLTRLISAASRATHVVKANRKQFLSLMQGSDLLLQEMLKRREAIRSMLTQATLLTRNLSQMIGENQRPVSAALKDLKTVTQVLNDTDASIDRALEGMAPTLRYLGYVVGSGPYGQIGVVSPLPDNYLCAIKAIRGCS